MRVPTTIGAPYETAIISGHYYWIEGKIGNTLSLFVVASLYLLYFAPIAGKLQDTGKILNYTIKLQNK